MGGFLDNLGLDNILGKDNNNTFLIIALIVIVVISLMGRDKKKGIV